MPETTLDDKKVDYKIRRSEEASRARIDVKVDEIIVVIPKDSSTNPERFMQENKDWVLKKKHKFEEFLDSIPNRKFREGEKFPYLNEEFQLKIGESGHKLKNQQIILSENKVNRNGIKEELEVFYRSKARNKIEDKIEKYKSEVKGNFDRIYIRNQKTKWGSCSPKDNLSFNWRLIMAPEHVLEYVVVHELVHLEERNHSKDFWNKVKEIYPQYKQSNKWLNENSSRLIFTEQDVR